MNKYAFFILFQALCITITKAGLEDHPISQDRQYELEQKKAEFEDQRLDRGPALPSHPVPTLFRPRTVDFNLTTEELNKKYNKDAQQRHFNERHDYTEMLRGIKMPEKPKETQNFLIKDVYPEDLQELIKKLQLRKQKTDKNTGGNVVCVHGRPGTGKTTYAKISTKEAGFELKEKSASSLINSFQNSGAETLIKWRAEIVDQLKATDDFIGIFIDELEAVAKSISGNNPTKVDESTRISAVKELQKFIDYFKDNHADRVQIFLATNDPKSIEKALASRVDDWVEVPLPIARHRQITLETYFKKYNFSLEKDLNLPANASDKVLQLLVDKSDSMSLRGIAQSVNKFTSKITMQSLKETAPGKKLTVNDFIKVLEETKAKDNPSFWQKWNEYLQDKIDPWMSRSYSYAGAITGSSQVIGLCTAIITALGIYNSSGRPRGGGGDSTPVRLDPQSIAQLTASMQVIQSHSAASNAISSSRSAAGHIGGSFRS